VEAKELVFLLRALMEWCIYPPPRKGPRRRRRAAGRAADRAASAEGQGEGDDARQCEVPPLQCERGGEDGEGECGEGVRYSSEASHDRLMREHAGDGEEEENTLPISWKCTDQAFEELLQQRDPTGLGLPDIWAVRLVRRLLSWRPEMRCVCSLNDDERMLRMLALQWSSKAEAWCG
jgi:hypothetical protein